MSALDEEQSIASLDQSYLDKEQNDNQEISNYSDNRHLTSVELCHLQIWHAVSSDLHNRIRVSVFVLSPHFQDVETEALRDQMLVQGQTEGNLNLGC